MYLDHRTVDGLNNFIVDAYITPGNVHDSRPYLKRLDYILNKYHFKTKNELIEAILHEFIVSRLKLVDETEKAIQSEGKSALEARLGAMLDVFRTEPLPQAHPFWTHPRITVTPHTSARTLRDESIAQIAGKICALERGETVSGVVDAQVGY